jgi:hypothetical protein
MAFLSIPTDSLAGSFAVFHGPEAFGIEHVNAMDAEHAVEITSALHPGSRLAAVPSYALEGCNKHKVLAAWLSTAEASHQAQQPPAQTSPHSATAPAGTRSSTTRSRTPSRSSPSVRTRPAPQLTRHSPTGPKPAGQRSRYRPTCQPITTGSTNPRITTAALLSVINRHQIKVSGSDRPPLNTEATE